MNIQNLENKNVKIIFLLLLLLISFSRSPFLFLEGRFIGEEAVHFFKYSYFNEWYKTLFYIEGISGYYYLTANINAIFANLLPISKAPLATVYGSLIILFLIFLIIFNTSSFLFKNIIDKYLGCSIVLFSPPFVAEVWLNSINTQVYLGILTIIILFIDFKKNENKVIDKLTPLILIMNGLSGLYSCVVTPFFLLKYFIKKNKKDLINFFSLLLCCFVQVSIVIYSKLSKILWPGHLQVFQFEELLNFVYNAIIKTILGREFTLGIINSLGIKNTIIFFSVFLLIFIFLIYYFYKKKFLRFDYVFFILILTFITMAVFVMYGNDGVYAGGRYSVINGTILLFLILNLKNSFQNLILKNLMYVFLFLNLFIGLNEFFPKKEFDKKLIKCIECPKWNDEIQKWNDNNKEYMIKLWPYSKPDFTDQKWMLDLKDSKMRTLQEYINPQKLLNNKYN